MDRVVVDTSSIAAKAAPVADAAVADAAMADVAVAAAPVAAAVVADAAVAGETEDAENSVLNKPSPVPVVRGMSDELRYNADGSVVLVNEWTHSQELKLDVARSTAREQHFGRKCLPLIFYDKPVKTGSTAIAEAIRSYIYDTGSIEQKCSYNSCWARAENICNSTLMPIHLLGHITLRTGLSECLRPKGYYTVTSIREPLQRWVSAYLFNKQMKGVQYGVSWNESLPFYMNNIPDCNLYNYYDRMSVHCDKGELPWQERLSRIIGRFDEVIDLYAEDTGKGLLSSRIQKFLGHTNVSERKGSVVVNEDFNRSRLVPEQKLYEELQKIRYKEPDAEKFPC